MINKTTKGWAAVILVIAVLAIDQWSKFWVKTHMGLGDEFNVLGDWFRIHFVENNGMAFGIEAFGKLFLTLFRIVAVIGISIYIVRLIKRNFSIGFILCVSLILAGAFGNIFDSVFYGMIFEASYQGHVASLVPWGEGYSSLFHGKVVDMFYFPIYRKALPDGQEQVVFFNFIFNVADAAISVGVALLLLFYRKTLSYSLLSKSEREKLENKNQLHESEV